ncbi:MAG: hypothetical protein E7095_00150 [Bacteroides sp.]|nr:hypothetical protein [Bacteroides sp.]
MKYWKLLAICMLPLSFVACSDDDDAPMNSGNATVEFQSANMQVKESTTMVEIPITVTGEHNGDILVTAKMISSSENYELDKDVIVTTENFVLPAETESVNLEVHLVDLANDAIEAGRTITFEITEVKGATLGGNKTCTVELKENNPLEGTYTLKGYSPFDGAVGSMKFVLSMEEGVTDKAYLECDYGILQMNLEEIEPGKKYNVTIPGYQTIGNHSSYGPIYFVMTFVDWSAGSVLTGKNDITGVFENGIIKLNLDEDYGIGVRVSAGFFEAFVSYVDDDGTFVPVTLTKK